MRTRMASFVKERNEVLFSLDRERIEIYFKKRGLQIPENDTVFWASIYKCICNITDAPDDLVCKEQSWLHAHGMSEVVRI